MNICMVLEDTYPSDIRVRKEARALIDDGHDVTLLCYAEEDAPATETVHGIAVRRAPLQAAHSGPRGMLRGAAYMATNIHSGWRETLAQFAEEEGIDVVHVHDLPLVKTAIEFARGREIRVVGDLHENWPGAVRQYRTTDRWRDYVQKPTYLFSTLSRPIWRLKRLERECVRGVDHVITVVEEGKTHYVENCDVPPETVTPLSNVVSLDQFPTDGVEPVDIDGEFIISYVGTLGGRHRGLETVIEALPSVLAEIPAARLLIVGPGSDYKRILRDLADDLGVSDRITFTGWVDFEAVPRYIAGSDVCLVPHASTPHTETTIPHKLFQYMALGKPVVVTDVAPLERVVGETASGIVVPAGDSTAMADAFRSLYADPDAAAKMGERGRRAVTEQYNWAAESRKLTAFYESL